MLNERLKLKNIGPISEADIRFGDLTILVGPQGTGKSIFLQFLKLILDVGPILGYLDEHGLNWHGDIAQFLELYVGEGTGGLWQPGRSEIFRRRSIDLEAFVKSKKHSGSERSFLISFGRTSPQARRIAQAGLRGPSKHADLVRILDAPE